MSYRFTSGDWKKFLEAAQSGQLKDVIELSSNFINDVETLSEALIESCGGGKSHLDVVKWLVEHTEIDVNYISKGVFRHTPLTAACRANHLNIVKYLMENTAANVNHISNGTFGSTPLITACHANHLKIVKYLVETCHADVNLHDDKSYESDAPLIVACKHVSMIVSRYLTCEVSELDFNLTDSDGNTALHYAVWCIKYDYSQLHQVCEWNRGNVTKVLKLLYESGLEINFQDNNGFTPLHYACNNRDSEIVETLMLAGADETITDDLGETPAQLAEREGYIEQLQLLDRDSLWEVMLYKMRKKLKLSLVFVIFALKLIRQTKKK